MSSDSTVEKTDGRPSTPPRTSAPTPAPHSSFQNFWFLSVAPSNLELFVNFWCRLLTNSFCGRDFSCPQPPSTHFPSLQPVGFWFGIDQFFMVFRVIVEMLLMSKSWMWSAFPFPLYFAFPVAQKKILASKIESWIQPPRHPHLYKFPAILFKLIKRCVTSDFLEKFLSELEACPGLNWFLAEPAVALSSPLLSAWEFSLSLGLSLCLCLSLGVGLYSLGLHSLCPSWSALSGSLGLLCQILGFLDPMFSLFWFTLFWWSL